MYAAIHNDWRDKKTYDISYFRMNSDYCDWV